MRDRLDVLRAHGFRVCGHKRALLCAAKRPHEWSDARKRQAAAAARKIRPEAGDPSNSYQHAVAVRIAQSYECDLDHVFGVDAPRVWRVYGRSRKQSPNLCSDPISTNRLLADLDA